MSRLHSKECYDAAEKRTRDREAWLAQWPNHCRACEGAGGAGYTEMHGFAGGGGEPMWDVCGCLEIGKCPRCGAAGFQDETALDHPCFNCGWSAMGEGFDAAPIGPDCPGCLWPMEE